MSFRKVWIFTCAALVFSLLVMSGNSLMKEWWLAKHPAAQKLSAGWSIADDKMVRFENASFGETGKLRSAHNLVLTRTLPATAGQSLCFVAIGYRVEALIDGERIYTFGSAYDRTEVWGVKTHIFNIPDGESGRELKLLLATDHPGCIAVSKHVLLAGELEIFSTLLKSALAEMLFSLFYIFIGLFILIFACISLAFKVKRFNLSLLALSFVALLIGIGIFFNLSLIALFTGPEFVFWVVNSSNLATPVAALLFLAADRGFARSRLLATIAVAQSIALLFWVLGNLFNWGLLLLDWHLPLLVLIAVILAATFVRELKTGTGRLDIVIAVAAVFVTSFIDAYFYFTGGDYDTMNYSLIIAAFPVLVLMTGRTVLDSVRREYHMASENMALRLEGELLYKNYHQTQKYIEDTKLLWHDIDKHLAVINRLAGNGEYGELRHYLAHVGYEAQETKKAYRCENKLVNAILTDKLSEAERKNIKASCTGNLPEHLQIAGPDLCSLLVNMLDNAIAACGKLPHGLDKTLEIALGWKNDFIYFSVSNPVATPPSLINAEFAAPKEDDEKHGYGIPIMQRIVRKYGGAFDITSSAQSFSVRAALKNAPARAGEQTK